MHLPRITACDRVEFICERIKDKSVLHLGCGDWPFTEHKIQKGALLHQQMLGIASEVVGYELEPKAVQLMQNAGIPEIHLGNAEVTLYQDLGRKFDVIVAGEVIEHVLNPGRFLESIKTVCDETTLMIVTTPNFAPIKRLPRLAWRNEEVHPDHVAYYSYSTLKTLLTMSGFEPVEWAVYWRDVGSMSGVVNSVAKRIPVLQYFSDGFCVTSRLPRKGLFANVGNTMITAEKSSQAARA